jgi:Family of unknown function (DUF6064)
MSEWWTYSLSDMLLFSPRVYYRLLVSNNLAMWPAQVLTVALGLAMIYALARPSTERTRATLAALGVLWILVAWAFFWNRYATINWGSPYVAPVYALQGLMLVVAGASGRWLGISPSTRLAGSAGTVLFAAVLVGYPLIAPLVGRPWSAAEVFGIAPDPTALATLALLAVARDRLRWPLMVIPLLWIAISTATLWAIDAPEFWIPPLVAIFSVAIACLPSR